MTRKFKVTFDRNDHDDVWLPDCLGGPWGGFDFVSAEYHRKQLQNQKGIRNVKIVPVWDE